MHQVCPSMAQEDIQRQVGDKGEVGEVQGTRYVAEELAEAKKMLLSLLVIKPLEDEFIQ